MAVWREGLFSLLLSLLFVIGSSERLHVHRMSLINSVGKYTCQPGRLFKGAMPKGLATVSIDHLKALGTEITAEDCLKLCCKLGQQRCQYLWVFGEACFSVGCEKDDGVHCQPRLLPSNVKMDSVYVKMEYVAKESDLDGFEKMLDDHLGEKGDDDDDDDDNKQGRPLVADAGGDVTVRLPAEVVHLYGNASKGNKGIKSYLWELISDHFVHPILKNTDNSILQVRNLIPGNYTFRLTVTDPDDQSSSASAVLHVLAGKEGSNDKTVVPGSLHTTVGPSSKTGQTRYNTSESGVAGDNSKHANEEEEQEGEEDNADEAYLRKRRIVLKIVVPVLLSVAAILTLSAIIVGLSACCCERNRRRMKRFYRYKRIPETIEKT